VAVVAHSNNSNKSEAVAKASSNSERYAELGSTGLRRWGGRVYEEFLPQLSGAKAVKVYREMSTNDPVIGAILFVVKMLIRSVEWTVEPADEDDSSLEAAEFLQTCLDDMSLSWEDTISDILSFLIYGWSLVEIVYKRRLGSNRDPSKNSRYNDGKIGWRKLSIRAQETLARWEFDEEGGLQAFVQRPPPDYKTRIIPISKALLFRTDTSRGNPEGISILRNAYRPWYFKKQIEEIEGIGIERDLAGIPVVWAPAEVVNPTTAGDRAARSAYLSLITNIRRDKQEGVLMPLVYDEHGNKLYDLTLLSTGGRRQFDTSGIVERYSRQIAMTVLADFILLGHEKVGSFALSESKTNLFVTALQAWLSSIAGVFNRYAIPRLWEVNGWKMDNLPRLTFGETEGPSLGELVQMVSQLAQVGIIAPDDTLEAHLRRLAGLPVVEEASKGDGGFDGSPGCSIPDKYP